MRSTLQSDGTLKEMPEFPKPIALPASLVLSLSETDIRKYESDHARYNSALSKCRTFTIVGTHGWKVGDVVEENVHYNLKRIDYQVYNQDIDSYWVAVPIADSQEELWKEVVLILLKKHYPDMEESDLLKSMRMHEIEPDIKYLEQFFTISKKE